MRTFSTSLSGRAPNNGSKNLKSEIVSLGQMPNKRDNVDNINFVNVGNTFDTTFKFKGLVSSTMSEYENPIFENPFRPTAEILDIFNHYRYQFATATSNIVDRAQDDPDPSGTEHIIVGSVISSPGLFNPTMSIQTVGLTDNLPIVNSPNKGSFSANATVNKEYYDKTTKQKNDKGVEVATTEKVKNDTFQPTTITGAFNTHKNVTDCTIKNLVSLSCTKSNTDDIQGRLGSAKYRYQDFMYCKDLGKVSNNHLITLRKFSHPIGDNIFADWKTEEGQGKEGNLMPDIGRMVTWFGTEDNKLEDILKFDYQATWKELNAKIQEVNTNADSESTGILGMALNTFNPSYNQMMANGFTGNHNLVSKIGGRFSSWLGHGGQYQNSDVLRNYDNNKVYTPHDTVQNTHTYEGKLVFNHEFSLVFNYQLRAYDNINPKSAFLDLIANILEVTYRRGKFWGGARKMIGPPQNTSGWRKVNAFIDQAWDKLGGLMQGLANGSLDFGSLLGQLSDAAVDLANKALDSAKGAVGTVKDGTATKKVAQWCLDLNSHTKIGQALKGALKNGLGRPQLYAMDSLLTGDNVGLWHVTVGNPLNPIMAFGNLIMTKAQIQHYGPLGLDDFPTGLKVTVTLKHGRGRDLTDIARMYTKGIGAIYHTRSLRNISDYFNGDGATLNYVYGSTDPERITANMDEQGV